MHTYLHTLFILICVTRGQAGSPVSIATPPLSISSDCTNFKPPTLLCTGPNNHHAHFLKDAPQTTQQQAAFFATFAQDAYRESLAPLNSDYHLFFHNASPGNHLAFSIYQQNIEKGCDVIVSFRGSISDDDWKTDFTATLSKCNIQGKNCDKFHTGMYEGWTDKVRGTLLAQLQTIDALRIQSPNQTSICKLHVVGHSLGAGMANIASLELKRIGFPLQSVYTYGTPRTGTAKYERIWRDELTNQNVDTHRIYSIDSKDHVDLFTATGPVPFYADSTETPLAILVPFTCDGSSIRNYVSFLQCLRRMHNMENIYLALTSALVSTRSIS